MIRHNPDRRGFEVVHKSRGSDKLPLVLFLIVR